MLRAVSKRTIRVSNQIKTLAVRNSDAQPQNKTVPEIGSGRLEIYGSRYLMSSYTQPKMSTTLPDANANIINPVSAFQSQSGANRRTRSKTIRGEAIDQISDARFTASDWTMVRSGSLFHCSRSGSRIFNLSYLLASHSATIPPNPRMRINDPRCPIPSRAKL